MGSHDRKHLEFACRHLLPRIHDVGVERIDLPPDHR